MKMQVKKTIKIGCTSTSGDIFRSENTNCPSCNNNLGILSSVKCNFCWNCGTELDWSGPTTVTMKDLETGEIKTWEEQI